MRTDFSQTSEFYFAIANVIAYLENHVPSDAYDVMDGGATIEIKLETLTQLRESPAWRELEAKHAAVGGYVSTQESDWEVVALSTSDGITFSDLAHLLDEVS